MPGSRGELSEVLVDLGGRLSSLALGAPHFTEGETEVQTGEATGPRSQLHCLGIGSEAQRLKVAEGSWGPELPGILDTPLLTCAGFSLPAPARWKCPELGNSAGSQRRRYDLGRGPEVGKCVCRDPEMEDQDSLEWGY